MTHQGRSHGGSEPAGSASSTLDDICAQVVRSHEMFLAEHEAERHARRAEAARTSTITPRHRGYRRTPGQGRRRPGTRRRRGAQSRGGADPGGDAGDHEPVVPLGGSEMTAPMPTPTEHIAARAARVCEFGGAS